MQPEGLDSFRRSFPPELGAAMAARRALDALRSAVDDDLLERSRLALTEVMTNSVKHARLRPSQLIHVHVALLVALLRIEVTDDGPGFRPVAARPDPSGAGAGGWGLWLVDQLTDRWGVESGHSTCVWLEFDRGRS
jgi:anti-sigma regulatory factor (Ser/Thr protein kinase)